MLKTITTINTYLNSLQSFFKQRRLLTLTLILLVLAAGILGFQKFGPKKIQNQYELSAVTLKDITKTVTASGKIKSETQVDLKFQTSGQLVWVGVKEGQVVKKWQAIAGLDQRELKKTLEKYLRDYSKERNDFEEDIRVTYRDTVLTDTLKRILEKNQWDLDKAVLDVELKDIALKYATLVSPIAGLVTHIDIPVAGINITPATAVFTVADPDHLIFEAYIDEVDIGLIQAGQSSKLVLDAYPDETFDLTVGSIDFNSTLDSSGSTVFLVKFNLVNTPDQKFKLGMNGEVTITVAEKKNVLAVPFSALIEDGTASIQLVKDKTITNQPVTIGIMSQEWVEITSGLAANQTIIVSKKIKK